MAQKLYSSALQSFEQNIENIRLLESLEELKRYLKKRSLKLLSWNEKYIAIPLNIVVELPPLGTYQNIDIRSIEPVLIVINVEQYPSTAPIVYPDRLDFPKDQLAHLYVAKKGKPPGFCLVRGDFTEWYSNKRLKDLAIRIENWLRDAASGELTENGDQFDPLRLEGYSGTVIYDYDMLVNIVNEKKSLLTNLNYAVILFESVRDEETISFKMIKQITLENIKESLEDFEKEKQKDKSIPSKKYYHYGYLVWSDNEQSFNNYSVTLPEDWESFKEFCAEFGIDTNHLERHIAELDTNSYLFFPVIVAIKRPKNVIGFSGNIEFINFYFRVDTPDVADEKVINNIPVKFQKHNQPLTLKKAKEISGEQVELNKYSLIVGCGALGSKIIMHFARAGATNFMIADNDVLSAHNLVRHAVPSNSVGLNKATAIKKEINNIYPFEKLSIVPIPLSGEIFLSDDLSKVFTWIFDFTASNVFLQNLVNSQIDMATRVCRVFISDFGNLGILFFEGKDRNPRVDDLQIMLYSQYKRVEEISTWLKNELSAESHNFNVTVGIGCNSETTVLSDDIVSMHAAYFSNIIKLESHKEQAINGKILLNFIQVEPFLHTSQKMLEISPMDVFTAVNDPSWQIRMKPGIVELMKKEMGLAMPHETGGVFVGAANYKTKVIHVVDLIKAPPDSESNPACFFRGVKGLPEAINEVNEKTANQLGYIGEWHTHPFGPNTMSGTDSNTVRKFKSEFENLQTPLPVFLLILTPTHILPYVF